MTITDDTVLDLRQFREEMRRQFGDKAVTSDIMDKFVTYRASVHGQKGPQKYYDLKMQFGEMKLNLASQGHGRKGA